MNRLAEPLLGMDEPLFEEIDGELVELPPMSVQSTMLASLIAFRLNAHALDQGLGVATTEQLFSLPAPVARNRRPDVAFVPAAAWMPGQPLPPGNAWAVLPSLCVEVVSPTDEAEELMDRITEYRAAGVGLVWVVYPKQRLVQFFTGGGLVGEVAADGVLEGGEAIPGFRLPLATLFPPAA